MKTSFHFLLLVILFSLSPSLKAKDNPPKGIWVGKVDLPTVKLTCVFYFTESDSGRLNILLDIPEQKAKGLMNEVLRVTADSLVFKTLETGRIFYGEILNDTTIKGEWIKNRIGIPLTLVKSDIAPTLNRPQTPQPPFPYLSEDVEFTNRKSGLKLAGTLTIPKNTRNCPAVVMISGSGAQDRDETIFEHKMFWVVADYFARNGIAVLRVDDRGVGGSEGNIAQSTSEDFAEDALAGIAFLKEQNNIDPYKLGLIGHSEGGLIAPIAATQSDDIAFFIMMAGPGMIGEQILYEQNDLSLKAAGMPEYAINQNRMVQQGIFEVLKNQPDSVKALEELRIKMSQGFYPGMTPEMQKAVDAKIAGVNNNWFRYFLSYDPQPTLARVECPVLALNGGKDVQVPVSNLEAIKKAITEGGNPNIKTIAFPELNHLFQNCTTGAVAEYAQIEETIDPEVLSIMKDWILMVSEK